MGRHVIASVALILVSLFVTSVSGWAQGAPKGGLEPQVGKVVTVEGSATIEHTAVVVSQVNLPSGPRPAKVGDPVYKGDVVATGADGKLGLTFLDGTALNVFSNARMELNQFVYDPNGKWNSSLFNLTKGAFTFVGGKMAKTGGIRVETPTATMGIRGTSSHIVILENGGVKFSTLVEEK